MEPASPRIRARVRDGVAVLSPEGDWIAGHSELFDGLSRAVPADVRALTIDLSDVGRLDTFGAWAIDMLRRSASLAGVEARILLPPGGRAGLLDEVEAILSRPPDAPKPFFALEAAATLGKRTEGLARDVALFFDLLGRLTQAVLSGVLRPARLRLRSAVHHLDRVGVMAIPIVALMTFLIGCIIAQQGFFHFQRFGATDYVVDLVTILVLREIGVLLVIIMVAGRSGSAYTAEIGSMKMREEIDALRTMGLDPLEYLILPRVLALIVAAPLLTIVGDAAALYGAGIVAWLYGDMSPGVYLERLREASSHIDFEVGLIKAPVMALIIGTVAALEGMKVEGSAESLGQGTTSSVVKSIFFVIVLDGVFAVLFAAVGM